MPHSREIIVKCPACGEKFDAQRLEDATFVSCPECSMQVKISGLDDRGRRRSRKLPRITALPARRPGDKLRFSDLARGGADMPLRKPPASSPDRPTAPSSDESSPKPGQQHLTTRERRLARELARVNELKRQIEREAGLIAVKRELLDIEAKYGGELSETPPEEETPPASSIDSSSVDAPWPTEAEPAESRQAADDREPAKSAAGDAEIGTDAPKAAEAPDSSQPPVGDSAIKAGEDAGDGTPVQEEQTESDSGAPARKAEEDTVYEKVQVSHTGKRRRLREAPVAEIPAPRGRRREMTESLERGRRVQEPLPTPVQSFRERQITSGSKWRRHKPDLAEKPKWEDPEADSTPKRRRKRSLIRRILVAAACLIALGSAHYGWGIWKRSTAFEQAPVIAPGQEPGTDIPIIDLFVEAKPVVEAFLRAPSLEAAKPYLRHADQLDYHMKKHYLDSAYKPLEVREIGPGHACLVNAGFLVIPLTLKDHSERDLALELATKKIDWESLAGYSEMGFPEMRLRRPPAPVLIRCTMLQNEYYNYAFSDRERYLSFRLTDSSDEHQLWGYIDRTSDVFTKMGAALIDSHGAASSYLATLRVKYPEGALANPDADQVLISEFITLGWVVRDKDTSLQTAQLEPASTP